MPEELNLHDLAVFLSALGRDLPSVLRDPNLVKNHPKGSLWLTAAQNLGVIRVEDERIIVDFSAIQALIEKVREVFDRWISSL